MYRSRCTRSRAQRGAIQLVAIVTVAGIAGAAGLGFAAQRLVLSDDSGERGRTAVPVFACPGEASTATVHQGDRVFAVAVHDELDGWLMIRNPVSPGERWWVEARFVDADGPTGELPELPCAPEAILGPSPAVPGEVLLPPGVTTTPGSGSSGGGGGGPGGGGGGPAPDTTGPSLGVSASPNPIWGTSPSLQCPPSMPQQSTISATFSDPSGIASVRATWTFGNDNANRNLAGGSTTFGPYAYAGPNPPQQVTITVRAVDNAGNDTVKTIVITVRSNDECFI